jgi:N6-L-threonylcarbamoyladenine synthase
LAETADQEIAPDHYVPEPGDEDVSDVRDLQLERASMCSRVMIFKAQKSPDFMYTQGRAEQRLDPMNVLGIETSCDETSAPWSTDRGGCSQCGACPIPFISRMAGSSPKSPPATCRMAARHCEKSGRESGSDGRGWTPWPPPRAGLDHSLLIGFTAARALALRLNKPLLGNNHLEAHLYSIFLTPGAPRPADICPFVMLLVSAGIRVCWRRWIGRLPVVGQTLDDAAGEALDKGAKLMSLGYPGGPAIEKAAAGGDPDFHRFPRGLENRRVPSDADRPERRTFQFQRIENLVAVLSGSNRMRWPATIADVAASYHEAVFDTLLTPVESALRDFPSRILGCAGGVARNRRLREKLRAWLPLSWRGLCWPSPNTAPITPPWSPPSPPPTASTAPFMPRILTSLQPSAGLIDPTWNLELELTVAVRLLPVRRFFRAAEGRPR